MIAETSESSTSPVFKYIGQNLYRLESSKVYYALLKRNGKQIRKSLKTTDGALAKRRLAEFREKVERLGDSKGGSDITFAELADRWLETTRVNLKPKSALRLGVCLKGLKPTFEGVSVRNITHRQCDDWIARRGHNLSASSYRHERQTLIAVLNYAVRDGLLLDNPAKEIATRKIPKPKIVIPTREQFRLLMETIRKGGTQAQTGGDLVELLAYSGMRLNEGTNLLWEDVSFERETFTVTGGEQGTKNHEARTIPLFPALRELLERLRAEIEGEPKGRVISIARAQTTILTACKRAGLPRFLHHSMRHYFCSNAIEAGIDFKVIAAWLGHKDGGVLVAKTYGHLRDTHSFEMAKRMTFSAVQSQTA